MIALLESWISKVGFFKASAIPKGISDGPMARMMIFLIEPAGPWTMKPSIKALSSLPTGRRVETLPTRPGVELAVAVGVALGVAVAVAVGVGVAAPSLSVIVPIPWPSLMTALTALER